MRGVTRFGLIALCLFALGGPAVGVCAAMAESMDACAMAEMPAMPDCVDEIAPSAGCCDPGSVDVSTELILKRLEETGASVGEAAHGVAPGAARPAPPEHWARESGPPPRPAPYRLFSALLL